MRFKGCWVGSLGFVIWGAMSCSGHASTNVGDGANGGRGGVDDSFAGEGPTAHAGSSAGGVTTHPGGAPGGGASSGGASSGGAPSGGTSFGGFAGDNYVEIGGDPGPCDVNGQNCGGAAGIGAGGDNSVEYPCDGGLGCTIEEGDAIGAVSADPSNLYWVDFGKYDTLGNYNGDGRLKKRAFSADTATQLAGNLAGPRGLKLTSSHAFVYLEQYWDTKTRPALVRVPLTGGAAQLVMLDVEYRDCPRCFASSGTTGYFVAPNAIYQIAPQDTKPAVFASFGAIELTCNGNYLYALGNQYPQEVRRFPLAGGAGELLTSDLRSSLQASGSYVYGLENPGGKGYLTRMLNSGGPWLRVQKAWPGQVLELQISGASFFHGNLGAGGYQFVQGALADNGSAVATFTVADWQSVRSWVGTSAGIFWSNGYRIRQRLNTP